MRLRLLTTAAIVLSSAAWAQTIQPFTDAQGHNWTVTNGVISVDGHHASYSSRVIQLTEVNGVVWQENADKLWWQWNGKHWGPKGGTPTDPTTAVSTNTTPSAPSAQTPSSPASSTPLASPPSSTPPTCTADEILTGAPPVKTTGLTFDADFTQGLSASPDGSGTMFRTLMANGGIAARTLPDNHEAECYMDPSGSSNPFSVSGRTLSITAAAANSGNPCGLPYNSGVLTTEKTLSQKYGYFAINAKIASGQGAWPAFWLYDIPYSEELDVFEFINSDPQMHSTIHGTMNGTFGGQGIGITVSDPFNTFHTYGVDWEPTTVTFYVDGINQGNIPTPAGMFNNPMVMEVNLAIGGAGSWPGAASPSAMPATMAVNWIRAYAVPATVNPKLITGSTNGCNVAPNTSAGLAVTPSAQPLTPANQTADLTAAPQPDVQPDYPAGAVELLQAHSREIDHGADLMTKRAQQ